MYSIQGLRTVGNSLPRAVNKILKKGGHNYSSIINNWVELVGKKTSDICYPRSIKTNRELENGILVLNVSHGNQLDVEYSKKDIIDKINSFFGYQFIKQIKTVLIHEKIITKNKKNFIGNKNEKINNMIDEIKDFKLKRKLTDLANEFGKKKSK